MEMLPGLCFSGVSYSACTIVTDVPLMHGTTIQSLAFVTIRTSDQPSHHTLVLECLVMCLSTVFNIPEPRLWWLWLPCHAIPCQGRVSYYMLS